MLSHVETHPLKEQISAEIHARPVPTIHQSVSLIYLAFLKDRTSASASRKYLADFLDVISAPPLDPEDACYYQEFDGAELRWESHQEFCSCLLILPQDSGDFFPELDLPLWWKQLVKDVPGQLINGVRLELRRRPTPGDPLKELPAAFGTSWVMGSKVVDGLASVWTSYQQDDDGLTRFLVFDEGLSPFQAGRTSQRLLESDTYRTVALLGFPLAREVWPDITALDRSLGKHTSRISEQAETSSDQALLDHISALSARTERLRARTAYRFSASRAYAEIALRRLADLRETRWPGTSSLSKFVERRFLPAMQTCNDADHHLRELSERIGQATALLRTRVELNQEVQNQKLLDAINRRGEMQMRMQQLVEGLSVIAITYYLAALMKMLLEGEAILPAWTHLLEFRVPGVVALAGIVYLYIRRRKKKIVKKEALPD